MARYDTLRFMGLFYNFSEEQTAVAELDGWARVRSSSNTISADCDVMDTSFSSKGFNTHQFNRPKPKVSRVPFIIAAPRRAER